jgi:DNA-binding transcriptional LysR family regulator
MQERQLEAFHAIMETGTVTMAATRLRISQPAVSKLLMGLERETGLVLFTRERQRLLPTAEARLLHQEVSRHFSGMARIEGLARDIRSLRTGKISIASLPALGTHVLPRLLTRFIENRMDARIDLQVRPSPLVIDRVLSQQVDLGFSVTPIDHPALRCEKLAEVDAVCVLPLGHALAGKPSLKPDDLKNERFISLGTDDQVRRRIDEVFESAGIERRLQIETHFSEVVCAFVSNHAGVSIVDALTAAEFGPTRLTVRAFEPKITFGIHILSPALRPPSLLVEAFIRFIREESKAWA